VFKCQSWRISAYVRADVGMTRSTFRGHGQALQRAKTGLFNGSDFFALRTCWDYPAHQAALSMEFARRAFVAGRPPGAFEHAVSDRIYRG